MRNEALERFQDMRFGIFITWTVFSGMHRLRDAAGGWAGFMKEEMSTRAIGRNWDKRVTHFDADEWARAFADAGARYVVFVPSHALDFALLNTSLTDYRSQRDYTRELADACARHGLAFGLYAHLATGLLRDYNHLLGRDNDAFGRIRADRGEEQDAYLDAWLTMLCEQYRPAFIWLDGWTGIARALERAGHDPLAVYDFGRIERTIHRCDPNILIGNKHVFMPHTDYRVTDHLFWDNNCRDPLDDSIPSECCDVLPGNRWEALDAEQSDFLSASEIEEQTRLYLKRFVSAVGRGVNYLVNVGPLPNGELQRVETAILRGMGQWIRDRGETLFGTRRLAVRDDSWGYALRKGDAIYAHVTDTSDIGKAQGFPLDEDSETMIEIVRRATKRGRPDNGRIAIGPLPWQPRAAEWFRPGAPALPLPMTADGEDGVTVDVSGLTLDPVDTIVRLR